MDPATRPPIRTGSDMGLRSKTRPTASKGDPDPALEKRKLVFWYQHNKGQGEISCAEVHCKSIHPFLTQNKHLRVFGA